MIALDANILVWGLRKQNDPKRPDMVERCAALIAELHELRQTILVPSIVLAEYLIGHTSEQQDQELDIVGRNFFVGAFDTRAAKIAAELYDARMFKQIVKDDNVPRQCLKADYKIIATAIRHGASVIYVDDQHFAKIANNKITVRPVPALRPEIEPSEPTTDDAPPARTVVQQGQLDFDTAPNEKPSDSPLAFSNWRARLRAANKVLSGGAWLTPTMRPWGRDTGC
jgi:predicted nucleic acid-binding protein